MNIFRDKYGNIRPSWAILGYLALFTCVIACLAGLTYLAWYCWQPDSEVDRSIAAVLTFVLLVGAMRELRRMRGPSDP